MLRQLDACIDTSTTTHWLALVITSVLAVVDVLAWILDIWTTREVVLNTTWHPTQYPSTKSHTYCPGVLGSKNLWRHDSFTEGWKSLIKFGAPPSSQEDFVDCHYGAQETTNQIPGAGAYLGAPIGKAHLKMGVPHSFGVRCEARLFYSGKRIYENCF
jgi:hypothetical protein